MEYSYVACNERGEVIRGRLSADSEDAVSKLISHTDCRLLSLKQHAPLLRWERLSAFSRVRPQEVILFYRQLALLLESGVNIITSIELLQAQSSNRSFKKVLGETIADLRRGNQLSKALAKHPALFSDICCRTLAIGERTGSLETMLRQMADYAERETGNAKRVKSALTYPTITLVVAVVVIGVLVEFVLPAFGSLYGSLGAKLPPLTRFILDGAAALKAQTLNILLALMLVAGMAVPYLRTARGRYTWHRLLLRLPLIGRVNLLNHLARYCRSISLLFRAGLPLTEIMPLVIQSSGNTVLAAALDDVNRAMVKGEGLSSPMSRSPLFLPMMVQMVRVGEETGSLDTSLLAVAQSYEAEAEDRTRTIISMIPPAMTMVIGIVVGIIALSLVTALYSIYGQAF